MRLAYLLVFYGEILDTHSRDIMRAYYEDDLSLSEIAEDIGISRQGVRHIIKKSEEQLDFLERKLGLADKFLSIEEAALSLEGIAERLSYSADVNAQACADEISVAVNKIRSKNN